MADPTSPTPIVGIAAVHVRDTAHQQPTQIMGTRPNWPSIDQISTVVDAADIKSSTGYMGGSLPADSQHWSDYLTSMWQILPTGKGIALTHNPDPTPVAGLIAQDANGGSVGGEDPWTTLRDNFAKMWTKGAPPSTYKIPNP